MRIAELQTLTSNRAAGIPDMTDMEAAIRQHDGQVRLKFARWMELGERKADLEQIKRERAAVMTDPNHQIISRMGGAAKFPGISTGLMVLNMKMLGKTAVPELELDTALLGELRAINRERSLLEGEIAVLMNLLKPVTVNIDQSSNTTLNDNRKQTVNYQVIKMLPSPADDTGQW